MKVIVAGGTGFLGTELVDQLLRESHSVVVLSRGRSVSQDKVQAVPWDGESGGQWETHVGQSDAVINLAGESIGAKRWTAAQKERILGSRLNATRAIVGAIKKATRKPSVLVNASAVGYYGSVPEGDVLEESPAGSDFLAGVCAKWESEAQVTEQFGVRVVRMRFAVLLGKGGGALQRMLLPFKLFAGGPLGSGRQWFPWVHRQDAAGAIVHAISNKALSGPVNVAAPDAVRMKEFCAALGRAMHRPSWAPVPEFVLKTALGEMSSMILTGQKVIPKQLQAAGYVFQFPTLEAALRSIV